MDLLLRINLGLLGGDGVTRGPTSATSTSYTPTTIIMVTHNPDLESYCDRVLYVEDGAFQKQVINRKQRRIDYHRYLAHINAQH
jgi:ABC-type transport system involved in cytochrome bd biosynthesis fused ATPase/permease subunit